jgi:hypothetical protein
MAANGRPTRSHATTVLTVDDAEVDAAISGSMSQSNAAKC